MRLKRRRLQLQPRGATPGSGCVERGRRVSTAPARRRHTTLLRVISGRDGRIGGAANRPMPRSDAASRPVRCGAARGLDGWGPDAKKKSDGHRAGRSADTRFRCCGVSPTPPRQAARRARPGATVRDLPCAPGCAGTHGAPVCAVVMCAVAGRRDVGPRRAWSRVALPLRDVCVRFFAGKVTRRGVALRERASRRTALRTARACVARASRHLA